MHVATRDEPSHGWSTFPASACLNAAGNGPDALSPASLRLSCEEEAFSSAGRGGKVIPVISSGASAADARNCGDGARADSVYRCDLQTYFLSVLWHWSSYPEE